MLQSVQFNLNFVPMMSIKNLMCAVENWLLESHQINSNFLVVTCDTTAIPAIDNAHVHSIRQSEDGLNLPGEVNITYRCDKGYSMDAVEEVVVGCQSNMNNRSGADGEKTEHIVTAEWEDTSNISCKIGKWLALVVDRIWRGYGLFNPIHWPNNITRYYDNCY